MTEGCGMRGATTGEVRLDEGNATVSSAERRTIQRFGGQRGWLRSNPLQAALMKRKITYNGLGIRRMSAKGISINHVCDQLAKNPQPQERSTVSLRIALLGTLLSLNMTAALASPLLVSESGTWSSTAPTTTWTAPNANFTYSFLVDSNPSVSFFIPDIDFIAPFSSFTYTLAGNTVATTPIQIQWFSTQRGGLFSLFFPGGIEFAILGAQAYSGPESAPTILTGIYPISTASGFCCDPAGNTTPISGDVVISAVPEPSTLDLMFISVACVAGFGLRRYAKSFLSIGQRRCH